MDQDEKDGPTIITAPGAWWQVRCPTREKAEDLYESCIAEGDFERPLVRIVCRAPKE